MAVYKVAQDVEAEDKLLGPFSFRQFIYLMVAAISIAAAWGLFNIFPPLAVIPLPIIVFFGVLALPLRKDQPTETWLAAIISFYIKPRKRLWKPDGIENTIVITAPKNDDVQLTKNLSTSEAEKRLSYLSELADSRGWSIRHAAQPMSNTAMVADVYNDAQTTQDMLDNNSGVTQAFDTMIDQADARRHDAMVARMHTPSPQPQAPPPTPATPVAPPTPKPPAPQPAQPQPTNPQPDPQLTYNPYPSSIHQTVVAPLGSQPAQLPTGQASQPEPAQPQSQVDTSVSAPSPAIMDLANNKDLSIEAISREANRRAKKSEDDEVVISLR